MLPRHPDMYTDDALRQWVWRLIDEKTEEGPRLDYKELQRLDSPNDKREIARDASSFLNTYGGIILYGIPEAKNAGGRPIPVTPYGMERVEGFGSRVENILIDSIKPAIPEVRVKEIPAPGDGGKVVYLLWVPESYVGVHMVESYGERRYWKRGQFRAVMMDERDVEERYRRLSVSRAWLDAFLESEMVNYFGRRLAQYH